MVSPRQFSRLKRGEKKVKLPKIKNPPLIIEGVEPTRVIKLPRFNKFGYPEGNILIVRQGNRAKVKNVVRKVKTKIRSRKSAA